MSKSPGHDESSGRFMDLFHVRPFAVVFGAELQSVAGDQLARIALSVLVFQRTGNAAATALTYALTFLPAIVGGATLGRLGDTFSRRAVMIGCDVVRAACFAVMAVPGMSLWVLEVVLALAVLLEPAFTAAQSSYLASCLDEDQYRMATGLRMATNQIGQIGGFAVGGALVALVEPRGALAINAVTFALSALAITLWLPGSLRVVDRSSRDGRTAAARDVRGHADGPAPARGRRWTIRQDPRLIMLIALASLAGFFVVPEGLVIPYAIHLGESTQVAGLLLAAIPAGGAVGALLLARFVPRRSRATATAVMSAVCGVPLLVTGWSPAWPVLFVAWFLSGVAAAYMVEVFTRIAVLAPDAHRSHTMGVASAVLTGAQGIGLAVFGLLAEVTGAGWAVTAAGGCGALAALTVMTLGHLRHAEISRVWDDAPASAEAAPSKWSRFPDA